MFLVRNFFRFNTTRNRWKRYICSQQFFHSIRLSLDSQFVSSSPPHLARPVPSPTPSATRPSEWGGRIRRESTRSISINDRKNSSRYIPSLDRPEWRAQPGHALWNLLTVFYPLPSYYFRFKRCQPCRRFSRNERVKGSKEWIVLFIVVLDQWNENEREETLCRETFCKRSFNTLQRRIYFWIFWNEIFHVIISPFFVVTI